MRGDKKLTAGKTGWIIAGAILHVACSGSTDARDTTPPSVTSTSPANSASGVLINSVLTVTFSEAMIPSTINPGSVTLKVTASGVAVSGNMTYDATSHLATFTPSAPLDYDTGYTLTVTPAALDLAGNPLTAHYSATFRSIQRVFGKPYFQGTNDIADSGRLTVSAFPRLTATFCREMPPVGRRSGL